MKSDFEASPVYLNHENRIKAHCLTCFLALLHFRLLNRSLKGTYTTEQLLHTLKDIKFADIEEQGFMPVYDRQEITDDLHEICGFKTDYQFIYQSQGSHSLAFCRAGVDRTDFPG